ncbi:ATP-dependent DNA helicase Q-like SIM [Carica papaya]|uniref:ATP-dependent DNA helicase Q-like SIM n=1 Tax=Carica papaya TaxID=3649 RepID=UPI000B8CBFAA|nr:ATP-dependent DNA helicase Q-like SIM [Carica papaya]XP_021898983.1 ATP-dependent DNA helicase Q-like SIM [Carica papaya]XP_021898984.1 ATP-dependent DNA helicase Q-like SIM [Carica papaya]XP_021898986.1 ATP-dependent DNA helicase Q-like SIM [Carica papaya]
MGGNILSSQQVIDKLVKMGFNDSDVMEAVRAVGPSCDDAVEYILNGCGRKIQVEPSSSNCSTRGKKILGKRVLSSSCSLGQMRQSSILDHYHSALRPKKSRADVIPVVSVSQAEDPHLPRELKEPFPGIDCDSKVVPELLPSGCPQEVDTGSDWEQKVNRLLRKHFGYSSLKCFQKEALSTWLAHKDCLVLAATGSGKSLCFQIPALLTGEVVVVISPLISLMHDQCLKLSKHGVSACFLGSGQPDSSVEKKAMKGMYNIIYVCPETVIRLVKPLQGLAESHGIALFAIDEVHCVSKWGHDFRPDYRRLSLLRENFSANNLKFLKFDIPLMALTATATIRVREDILKSLCMSKETKIVLTSFFRPNLRFSLKHSRTSSSSSYREDFQQLIDIYGKKKKTNWMKQTTLMKQTRSPQEVEEQSDSSFGSVSASDDDDEVKSIEEHVSTASRGREMTVEYLESEADIFQNADDWDVACGEFCGQFLSQDWNLCGSFRTVDQLYKPEEGLRLQQEPLEGPTIIYVPTRKETISIAKFLSKCGVKAAAYNASLSKSHLRRVHKEFHEDMLEVVVATIAFGMGIDKLNVRRIVHYGWPQSLEAYYQEAGRAGRDGKLADCILYANLSRVPTLLPSRRSEDQTKQAYKMLSDCFRYGMNTACCRAKMLVEYFGEDFSYEKCHICDVCVDGPPELENLREEANILMQVIASCYVQSTLVDVPYDDYGCSDGRDLKPFEKPTLRTFVSKIREQSQKFMATDLLWWRGLARIMENKGYIKEGDGKIYVQIKFPEPTEAGLNFLQSDKCQQPFYIYPEADMLLATKKDYSFSEWGKGWADPEIRRQRLQTRRPKRKRRKVRVRKSRTVRGRIEAKLSKKK